MWPNLQETADFVTFTEEIPNWKLHFLCSENTDFNTEMGFKWDLLHIWQPIKNIRQLFVSMKDTTKWC